MIQTARTPKNMLKQHGNDLVTVIRKFKVLASKSLYTLKFSKYVGTEILYTESHRFKV